MPPRAVIYSPYSPTKPGAAGMRVHALENECVHQNIDARILTPADATGWNLARKIRSLHPQWVLATSPPLPPTLWALMGARLARAKLVVDAKDDGRFLEIISKPAHARSLKEKAFLQLRRFIYRQADELWFLTQEDLEEAQNRYRLSSEKLRLVPNGTDARITFDARHRARMRKSLHTGKKSIIIYTGSVGDEDLEGMLDALKKIKKPLHVLLILSTDATPENERDIARLETMLHAPAFKHTSTLRQNVPVTEVGDYLSAADVGIVPWRDFLPTSVPVKLWDYWGTGLRAIAKGPSPSALQRVIAENSDMESTFSPSWETTRTRLLSFLQKKDSTRQRRARATASQRFARSRIMRAALAASFHPHAERDLQ